MAAAAIPHIIEPLKEHFKDRCITIIELGIWLGDSTDIILKELNVKKYYGIDLYKLYKFTEADKLGLEINTDKNENNILIKSQLYEYGNEKSKGKILENCGDLIYNQILQKYSNQSNVEIIRKFTHEASNIFDNDSVDFCFIDAGHKYEQVLADIKNYFPKIVKGGILAGDDYFCTDVANAVEEFFKDKEYTIHFSKTTHSSKGRPPKPVSWYIYK